MEIKPYILDADWDKEALLRKLEQFIGKQIIPINQDMKEEEE